LSQRTVMIQLSTSISKCGERLCTQTYSRQHVEIGTLDTTALNIATHCLRHATNTSAVHIAGHQALARDEHTSLSLRITCKFQRNHRQLSRRSRAATIQHNSVSCQPGQ